MLWTTVCYHLYDLLMNGDMSKCDFFPLENGQKTLPPYLDSLQQGDPNPKMGSTQYIWV